MTLALVALALTALSVVISILLGGFLMLMNYNIRYPTPNEYIVAFLCTWTGWTLWLYMMGLGGMANGT